MGEVYDISVFILIAHLITSPQTGICRAERAAFADALIILCRIRTDDLRPFHFDPEMFLYEDISTKRYLTNDSLFLL